MYPWMWLLVGLGCSPDDAPPETEAVAPTCSAFPEASDMAEPGAFAVVDEALGLDCTIYRPEILGDEGRRHPVILWGNGTDTVPQIYQGALSHWASHGFIVAAANTPWPGTGEEMID